MQLRDSIVSSPIFKLSFVMFSLFASPLSFAQNFTIAPAPGFAFPSSVSLGGLTSAYYTVTNNTSATLTRFR